MFNEELSEFERILEKTTEARMNEGNRDEFADELSTLLGSKITGIFEQHQRDIKSLTDEQKEKLFKAVREKMDTTIEEVQKDPGEVDL